MGDSHFSNSLDRPTQDPAMRIFLTGGTGYIGLALARRLAAAGHEGRALVPPPTNAGPLKQPGIAPFRGDVADRASMREGMSGADWVIHAAATVELGGPPEPMRQGELPGGGQRPPPAPQ